MSDLISRQAAIELWEEYHHYIAVKACEYNKKLRSLPSAERRGRWIWDDEGYHCSECFFHAYGETGEILSGHWHYCPNCGAKMEEIDE